MGAAVATAAKFARWGVAELGLAPVHAVPGRTKINFRGLRNRRLEVTVEALQEEICQKRSDTMQRIDDRHNPKTETVVGKNAPSRQLTQREVGQHNIVVHEDIPRAVSRPFFPRFSPFFARFHRLDGTVPTSPKPEPRAKKQPARGPRGENSALRSTPQVQLGRITLLGGGQCAPAGGRRESSRSPQPTP